MEKVFRLEKLKYLTLLAGVILVAYSLLIGLGYKRFIIWPQITDYYSSMIAKHNPIDLCLLLTEQSQRSSGTLIKIQKIDYERNLENCKNAEPPKASQTLETKSDYEFSLAKFSHLVREAIFYPIIKLALITNINGHLIFSWMGLLILIFVSLLLTNLIRKDLRQIAFSIYFTSLAVASLFMNGRMIFSFLSIGLLIWAMTNSKQNLQRNRDFFFYFVCIFMAFVFSNISSGINVLLLTIFLIHASLDLARRGLSWQKWTIIFCAVIFQSIWVLAGLTKNVVYFGGNIFDATLKMADHHGLGQIQNLPGGKWLILAGTIALIMFIFKIRKQVNDILWIGFFIFLFGGVFGLSTLTGSVMFFIALLVRHVVSVEVPVEP